MQTTHLFRNAAAACLASVAIACGSGSQQSSTPSSGGAAPPPSAGGTVIRITGSDTMVNLVQAWAENYRKKKPDVSVQVAGGGSGVGIAGLIDGILDLAAASREMDAKETERAAQKGHTPVKYDVALDALSVYVHKNNPVATISEEELAEIYGDKGTIEKWSQLGVQNGACNSDTIVRVGRQNSSGTYVYFREAVLGNKREFKLGSIDQSGSKDVVALVGRTPCAIGYSGMAYATPEVKALPVSKKKGESAVAPTTETAMNKTYPLARALYLYSPGEPKPHVKEFLDWVVSPEGQHIVSSIGYVPVSKPTS